MEINADTRIVNKYSSLLINNVELNISVFNDQCQTIYWDTTVQNTLPLKHKRIDI